MKKTTKILLLAIIIGVAIVFNTKFSAVYASTTKVTGATLSSTTVKNKIKANDKVYLPTVNIDSITPASAISNIEISSYWIHNYSYIYKEDIENLKFEGGEYTLMVLLSTLDSEKCVMDYNNFPDSIVLNGITFNINSVCDSYVSYSHDFEAKMGNETKPTITTNELDVGYKGKNYSMQLAAWGTGSIKWSLKSGDTLPKGLKLSSTGTLLGTIKESGKFNFTVKASNEYGTVSKKYSLEVKNINYVTGFKITSTEIKNVKLGKKIATPTVTIKNIVSTEKAQDALSVQTFWTDENYVYVDPEDIFKEKNYKLCFMVEVKDSEKTKIDYEKMPNKISVNGEKFNLVAACESYVTYAKGYSLKVKKYYTLSKNSFIYNGKTQKPDVVVKDEKGKVIKASNYTVTYPENSKKIGEYKIKVKFKSPYIGSKTLTYSILPDKVANVKAKVNNNNTVKLTWNKNAGNVSGYRIYMYSDALGKYKYMGKTKNNYFNIKKLDEVTTYKFKVRAYKKVSGENIEGKDSKTVKVVTNIVTVPTITKITPSNKAAKLKWNSVNCADGYQIFMKSEKDDDYTRVKTIKSNVNKYTKNNLKNKTKYYFKVRAYKKIGGKVYYSPYSKTKSIQL